MTELFRRRVYVMASQVGICDAEKGPYPSHWSSADEIAIAGSRGIAISAPGDEEIDVVVRDDREAAVGRLIYAAEIEVLNEGVLVGTAYGLEALEWRPGKVLVQVFTEGPHQRPTTITFVLCGSRQ